MSALPILVENHEYLTVVPQSYVWKKGSMQFRLTIPAGFNTDLASAPWWAKLAGFRKEDPGWVRASQFHDFLYFNKRKSMNIEYPHSYQALDFNNHWLDVIAVWKRAEVDALFRKIMLEDGYPKWKANVAYWAVRTFGGIHSHDLFW